MTLIITVKEFLLKAEEDVNYQLRDGVFKTQTLIFRFKNYINGAEEISHQVKGTGGPGFNYQH